MPPSLDAEKVRKLGALAGAIDGASLSSSSDLVAEFNQCAGTTLTHAEFQGIYGAEEHVDWVRRLLWEQQIRPAANVSRDEIVELVRRCTPVAEWSPDLEAYAITAQAAKSVRRMQPLRWPQESR